MQVIAISAFGGPECLMLVDLPVSTCGPNQVVVNVQAAGVGMWDVKVGNQRGLFKRWERRSRDGM